MVEGGPLRTIITSLLLDHAACDRDTRREAENVLRAVGFSGGYSDLELCQFDIELLTDWYRMRAYVTPQVTPPPPTSSHLYHK